MPYDYLSDPRAIEQQSFKEIRALTPLDSFTREQQQVVMRVVHSLGRPELAKQVRFSEHACSAGMNALANDAPLLCDVEMVKHGITKRMISQDPLCFLNHDHTAVRARKHNETRTMAALTYWIDYLAGSVVIIGNAPTALFRLLEMLDAGCEKPALIIGMPVGFVGAQESKDALWAKHQSLGIECITLLGREGGSAVAAASCNALLRCNANEYY